MKDLKTGGVLEMAKLIYPINVSLDGYMEDENGNLDWSISMTRFLLSGPISNAQLVLIYMGVECMNQWCIGRQIDLRHQVTFLAVISQR